MATGGPQRYSGRPMGDSHRHLMITAGEWQAFLDDLQLTLDKFRVPAAESQRGMHGNDERVPVESLLFGAKVIYLATINVAG